MLSHWLGWIALVIGVMEFFVLFIRKYKLTNFQHFRGKHHIHWGKIMLVVSLIHGLSTIFTGKPHRLHSAHGSVELLHGASALHGAKAFLFFEGILCLLVLTILYLTYHYRREIGAKWLKWHKYCAFALCFLLILHIVVAL